MLVCVTYLLSHFSSVFKILSHVTFVFNFSVCRFEQQSSSPELLLPPAGCCNAAAVHKLADAAAALKQLRD